MISIISHTEHKKYSLNSSQNALQRQNVHHFCLGEVDLCSELQGVWRNHLILRKTRPHSSSLVGIRHREYQCLVRRNDNIY